MKVHKGKKKKVKFKLPQILIYIEFHHVFIPCLNAMHFFTIFKNLNPLSDQI